MGPSLKWLSYLIYQIIFFKPYYKNLLILSIVFPYPFWVSFDYHPFSPGSQMLPTIDFVRKN
jgi:hypothetical protein